VGKANIVIKNNNNRRASERTREEGGRGKGKAQRESTQPPRTKQNDGYFASVVFPLPLRHLPRRTLSLQPLLTVPSLSPSLLTLV